MLEPTTVYTPSPNRYDSMTYNHAGESGLKLPAISLGFWHNFGDTTPYDTMRRIVFTAFDNGITHFDLANNYGPEPGSAEKNCGRLLHEYFHHHRDELIISTKAGYEMWTGPYGDLGSRKYLLASLDQSLKRLNLDYVDIFYHHHMDPSTPLEETMGALATAVSSGKALYVGLSNYDGPTLEKATAILDEMHVPFIINQNRYNIFDRTVERNGLKETAHRLGKGLITFSPLAQGLLTNRYLNGVPADSRIAHDGRFLQQSALTPERLQQIRNLNDFGRLRYVVAGAEKLSPEVRALWVEKFGISLLEGYGVTECAPVIAVNVPMACRIGSVGQLMPGMQCQIEPVPGIERGGALHVFGPNVMKGYLLFDQPGVLRAPDAPAPGWYSTGDVVERDADGFIHILGRIKRFAKIAGEMVSLEVVERNAAEAAPGFAHAASTRADAAKGEAVVLFTTAPTLTREQLSAAAKAAGSPELSVPRLIRHVQTIPLLGTGKTDYVALKRMAESDPAGPTDSTDQVDEA